MLLNEKEVNLVVDIVKKRFVINNENSKVHQDETGNTSKLVLYFFLFLKDRGYILKKYKSGKGVSYRELNDYIGIGEDYNISMYIDDNSRKKIRNKKNNKILDIYYDGKSLFKLFMCFLQEKHPELIKDYINFASLSIYINDYLFYFLRSIRYDLFYDKKKERISLDKEIEDYNKKIRDSFLKMISNPQGIKV
jgi:hypothetical protein